MLTFESRYPCPVRLVHGGGVGRYGLCAMELLGVMVEGQPSEWVSSVNEDLRTLLVNVNDLRYLWESPEARADELWPILPKLVGTDLYNCPFPRATYSERLQVPPSGTPWGSLLMFINLHGGSIHEGTVETWQKAALSGLKEGVSLYWETWGGEPQQDFTKDQMGRLENFLKLHEGDRFLERMVYATA